jgi:hypothetical protein
LQLIVNLISRHGGGQARRTRAAAS